MRFEEDVHWTDGLFLQPHHLQRMQYALHSRLRAERAALTPFPYGLVDFEIDDDALANGRVVVKRLSALMPGGEEISMPGNAVIPPLDISEELENHRECILVSLALPLWSELDANLADGGDVRAKRLFSVHETLVRDENTGDNEIPLARRRLNARLTTDARDNADLELLPLLRVRPLYRESGKPVPVRDSDFVPPFLALSADCPLLAAATELNIQLRSRRNKILSDLTAGGFTSETLSGETAAAVIQLGALNAGEGRLTSLLATGKTSPFRLYLELKTLLGQLAALQPLRDLGSVAEYDHENCAPCFRELFMHIRSLIMAEGVSSYVRLDFAPDAAGNELAVALKDEHLVSADEYYLALRCSGDTRRVIEAVETGDNFRLVNPSDARSRVRGVKLSEMLYPPRFRPALTNTLWFRLEREESPHVWTRIRDERGMLVDRADGVFPRLEVSLFITVLNKGGKA